MKITLSMLKSFLQTEEKLESIINHINSLGIEVEEVINRYDELKDFSVAEIIETKPHPNADKLKICTVNNGNENLEIVCGASNARSGIKVILAPIGSTIPSNNMKIKLSNIRGVTSNGMLCSGKELAINDEDEGIIEMASNSNVGDKLVKYFGLDDPIINLSITPNRGDCFSVYGIARDLAAKGVGKLTTKINNNEVKNTFKTDLTIDIKNKSACSQLYLLEIRNIKNNQSPLWLQNILNNIGVKTISAIVDITNYMTICYGRPLHAYDRNKIGNNFTIEDLSHFTSFTGLDKKQYNLSPGDLIISSEEKVISLPGIIGGEDTGCSTSTKNIILESAYFDPTIISKIGRKYNIITDARHRFERGVDPNFVIEGAIIAANMIKEICGGEISLITSYRSEIKRPEIKLYFSSIFNIINHEIKKDFIKKTLTKLGCQILSSTEKHIIVKSPSWRHDIKIEEDLIEEILRIYGYDKIEEEAIPIINVNNILTFQQNTTNIFKRILTSRGLDEIITWSFSNSKTIKKFYDLENNMMITNPISQDLDYMRPTIIPNILNTIVNAINNNKNNTGFFEIGPIFKSINNNIEEITSLAAIRYGNFHKDYIRNIEYKADIYDIKADLLSLIEYLGFDKNILKFTSTNLPQYYHPTKSKNIKIGNTQLGYIGEIHPKILEYFDIKDNICALEINLLSIPETKKKYGFRKTYNKSIYPGSKKDFAFIIDKYVEVEEITSYIKSIDKNIIEKVSIFDIYQGNQISNDKKSIAIEVIFRDKNKTLNEENINTLYQTIINKVQNKFKAILRN